MKWQSRVAAKSIHSDLHRPPLHARSEEHTSELQSLTKLVCLLLLVKIIEPSAKPINHSSLINFQFSTYVQFIHTFSAGGSKVNRSIKSRSHERSAVPAALVIIINLPTR